MAKFVLAGKAGCPHYAKAELLADRLKNSLPNFRIHKIAILSDEWKEWLEATCRKNGWEHEESPLVWRELVHQGGTGMLIGGFSGFLEHCQAYYSVTSDMPTDLMLSIAAENLEAKMSLIAEEQHRASLIKPLHIWIMLSVKRYDILGIFIDNPIRRKNEAVKLYYLQVTTHTDLGQAFQGADVIILLDERWCEDSDADNEEEKKRKQAMGILDRYREYGQLIDTRASREVKVLVSGDLFVNLRCSLLLDNARSIDRCQFVGVATQLENEARAIAAQKLKVRTADVKNVIVWGNISGSFYIDMQRAKVSNYDGPIKGPAFFSIPVLKIIHERKWLETEFQDLVRSQRAAVVSGTCRATGMSSTNGILTVLKSWNGLCGPDEVFSMGVHCSGRYNLPEGVVVSVPVTFADGKWSVLFDGSLGYELREWLQLSASEIRQVRYENNQAETLSNAQNQ
uniref:Lactate/malate dehydrogenase C-terminal domain-containing protein n=1 Tax=Mola mola TaxID=94237 RepID=A0A3Q3W212_MOLML